MKNTGKTISPHKNQVIKTIPFMMALLLTVQCVDKFDPGISEDSNLVAVDGSLVKGRREQKIVISRTAPLSDPGFRPVTDCEVKITDDAGNVFLFEEEADGIYTSEIDNEALQYDREYQLIFTTPDGGTYTSDMESLIESAPVDNVYYEVENQYSGELDMTTEGIQFYADLKAPDQGARYYRWELEETYEHTSPYTIGGYFDGEDIVLYDTPTDSLYRCWTTENVPELFSENTVNLIKNEKKQIPLHYIRAGSKEIAIRYSLLVKQYALNESAYNYWNQRKVEAKESGGLYSQQPSQATSNIRNIDDENERVLGYFWTSSLSQKRIFCDETFTYNNTCVTDTFRAAQYANGPFPVYFVGGNTLTLMTAHPSCFDCSYNGAALKKPEFW